MYPERVLLLMAAASGSAFSELVTDPIREAFWS